MVSYMKGAKCLVMALCLGPGAQRFCWVHVLTCERWKMLSHGPMSGARGAMAPVAPWIHYCFYTTHWYWFHRHTESLLSPTFNCNGSKNPIIRLMHRTHTSTKSSCFNRPGPRRLTTSGTTGSQAFTCFYTWWCFTIIGKCHTGIGSTRQKIT